MHFEIEGGVPTYRELAPKRVIQKNSNVCLFVFGSESLVPVLGLQGEVQTLYILPSLLLVTPVSGRFLGALQEIGSGNPP